MDSQIFARKDLIDKANRSLVITVSVAVFVVVFSLIAMRSLIAQAGYQNKIISKKRQAVKTLQDDVAVAKQVSMTYQAFDGATKNIIGGISDGTTDKDGSNTKIVLDALPAQYDFPALTTNIESLVESQGVKLSSITGTDDEVAQLANKSSGAPTPVAMPFDISISADYTKTQALVLAFERSIRPMKLLSMNISGSQSDLTTTIKAETYYQPAKLFNIKKEVVKQ